MTTEPTARQLLEQARGALEHYTDVVASVNDPADFTPKMKDEGIYARGALASIRTYLAKSDDAGGVLPDDLLAYLSELTGHREAHLKVIFRAAAQHGYRLVRVGDEGK